MVIGIDEVGRGAWAGPMLFCAVMLGKSIPGLTDSKKLTKIQREKLSEAIVKSAQFIGYGWVSPQEIDDLGLTKASELACRRVIKKAPKNTQIIIDGNINYLKNTPNTSNLIGGDNTVPAISAASIVAKVERDKIMSKYGEEYPECGFATNVGYGTKKHIEAIAKHGLTPIHRWSYKPIKEFLDSYEA